MLEEETPSTEEEEIIECYHCANHYGTEDEVVSHEAYDCYENPDSEVNRTDES